MKSSSLLSVLLAACLLVVVGCSKPYVITDPLMAPLEGDPVHVSVGEIHDELPLDMDVEDKPTMEDIEKLRGYLEAHLEDDAELFVDPIVNENTRYIVEGAVIEFDRGSGVARFLIGFGAGNARMTTYLKLVDRESNQVLFAGNFSREISHWAESGEKSFDYIAKDFAKQLHKEAEKLKQQYSNLEG